METYYVSRSARRYAADIYTCLPRRAIVIGDGIVVVPPRTLCIFYRRRYIAPPVGELFVSTSRAVAAAKQGRTSIPPRNARLEGGC